MKKFHSDYDYNHRIVDEYVATENDRMSWSQMFNLLRPYERGCFSLAIFTGPIMADLNTAKRLHNQQYCDVVVKGKKYEP